MAQQIGSADWVWPNRLGLAPQTGCGPAGWVTGCGPADWVTGCGPADCWVWPSRLLGLAQQFPTSEFFDFRLSDFFTY